MPAADPLASYDQVFEDAGQAWNDDPLLLKAIGMVESGGDPKAISKGGAQGLMQITPDTQKYLGVTDPFDPVQSIFGAAKYLSEGLDKEGSPEGALLYYHGGPNWRNSWGPESQGYVPAVTAAYTALLKARAAAQPPMPEPPPAASVAPQAPSPQAAAQQASQ